MGAASRERDQSYRESASLHAERREQLGHDLCQLRGALGPLGGERRARACEVRGGRFTLLGDVTQVQIGGIEQLDTADLDLRNIDRKSTRLNSSHLVISYAVFCLKKKKKHQPPRTQDETR